jgi:hypothetical protein
MSSRVQEVTISVVCVFSLDCCSLLPLSDPQPAVDHRSFVMAGVRPSRLALTAGLNTTLQTHSKTGRRSVDFKCEALNQRTASLAAGCLHESGSRLPQSKEHKISRFDHEDRYHSEIEIVMDRQ